MPISVVCKGCNKTLRAPDNFLGKKVRCPKCQTAVLIETFTATVPASALPDIEEEAPRPRQPTFEDAAMEEAAVQAASRSSRHADPDPDDFDMEEPAPAAKRGKKEAIIEEEYDEEEEATKPKKRSRQDEDEDEDEDADEKPAKPKKKKGSGLGLVLIIILVVVLAAGGAALYFFKDLLF